jgi:hypothetical protein
MDVPPVFLVSSMPKLQSNPGKRAAVVSQWKADQFQLNDFSMSNIVSAAILAMELPVFYFLSRRR